MGCGSLGTVGDHTKTLEMSDEDKEEEEVMMSAGWFQSPPISWGIISHYLPAAPFLPAPKQGRAPKKPGWWAILQQKGTWKRKISF